MLASAVGLRIMMDDGEKSGFVLEPTSDREPVWLWEDEVEDLAVVVVTRGEV